MCQRRPLYCCVVMLFAAATAGAADSDVADAAQAGNWVAVRALLEQGADVDAPQIDGTTALHWAVRRDRLDTTRLLIRGGADVVVATHTGVTPMQLATINGNALIIETLLRPEWTRTPR